MSGFVPQPGTDFSSGDEKKIADRLAALGRKLGKPVYGISGYRTPQHSVEVGGFRNDPHTKGQGADVGLGAPTRESFAQVSDKDLASVGLYRPFPGNPNEINHVALKPSKGGGLGAITGALEHVAIGVPFVGPAKAGFDLVTGGPDKVKDDASGAVHTATDAATDAAKAAADVPGQAAKALVSGVTDALKDNGLPMLLYVVLVGAGLVLFVTGLTHATGTSVKGVAAGIATTVQPELRAAKLAGGK